MVGLGLLPLQHVRSITVVEPLFTLRQSRIFTTLLLAVARVAPRDSNNGNDMLREKNRRTVRRTRWKTLGGPASQAGLVTTLFVGYILSSMMPTPYLTW